MRLAVFVLFTLFAALTKGAYAEEISETLDDYSSKLNYSVGYRIGSDFKYQDIEVRSEALIKGIEDAMAGNEALMSKEQMNQAMADLGKQVAELKRENREQQAKAYAESNRQFLVENGKKKGVVTTASGLQYRVLESGGGSGRPHPKPDSQVLVHYRGRLIDGTEFDSSYKRGKPADFRVNQVIKGWTEALQLMRQGDHWQLFIPAELAYGDKGAGASIPPDSTLIFDVELISIQ